MKKIIAAGVMGAVATLLAAQAMAAPAPSKAQISKGFVDDYWISPEAPTKAQIAKGFVDDYWISPDAPTKAQISKGFVDDYWISPDAPSAKAGEATRVATQMDADTEARLHAEGGIGLRDRLWLDSYLAKGGGSR